MLNHVCREGSHCSVGYGSNHDDAKQAKPDEEEKRMADGPELRGVCPIHVEYSEEVSQP